MNNKGFTFVELLAIIIILAVILAITVPRTGILLNASYNQTYEIFLQDLESGAKNYILRKNVKV